MGDQHAMARVPIAILLLVVTTMAMEELKGDELVPEYDTVEAQVHPLTAKAEKAVFAGDDYGPSDSMASKYHLWIQAKKLFFKAPGPMFPPSQIELNKDKESTWGSKAYRMANTVLHAKHKFAKKYKRFLQAKKHKKKKN